jgi:hypothetical protein
MKDPIRVAPRQIKELNRLLANRLDSASCTLDTAGVDPDTRLRPVTGDTVDVSREKQYIHTQHRMVFCECKDWPSKFPSDKEWCRNWKDDTDYDRFYKNPYNFDTNGQF